MNDAQKLSQALLTQRSHLLVALSGAITNCDSAYREWYRRHFRQAISQCAGVLTTQQYEQHEFDLTLGRFPRLPFKYLTLLDISVDGAEAAGPIIDQMSALHSQERSAREPATWLYYPAGEKVGRSARTLPSLLTVAFANGLPGQEASFREWYCTRHVRHALRVDALVSGQCFERTQFQKAGAQEAAFATIAIYEQEGTPESMLESFASIPPEAFAFPMLDLNRFSESVYRPV